MEWFRYFFGTPQRAVRSLIALGLISVIIFPGLLLVMVERFVAALMPLLGPTLAVAIVIAGLRLIVGRGR